MHEKGFEVIAVSAHGSEIKEIEEREGVKHFVVPFTRTISPIKDLMALAKLIRLMISLKPHIVHTHTPKAGLLGMIAAYLSRVPVRMHTVAGLPVMEAQGFTRKILTFTESLTYKCASKIYPNSFQLKEWIVRNIGPSQSKISVIGNGTSNGIDTNYYSIDRSIEQKALDIRQELRIDSSEKVLVFVGRLVRDKGIVELIKAFNLLNSQSLHLVLVGGYEDERDPVPEETKALIEKKTNIKAVGFQKDIRPYLALADIFVFPSYREGFPNVVLQALSMGLCCIVTDINGCNEVISHGINGLIVKPKDSESLQKALMEILSNDKLFKTMSENARSSVVDKYEQKKYWKMLLMEYKRALSKNVPEYS
ncbi:MAG: glycosyltransferase family 4 protein [Bacteroidota bacterium]